ncbi:hypothetical protein GALMADRAFT_68608 [Galerina marginata CBS 339.88]|uniref:Uncharacterized protein n=1 Tax=Galerina marginata (strain CBS 339.88) TaxID=685588 RepID=A0A067T964_GALM3|nr:hypothetical protein GALMADRAFT_68608 [Galerina marginata CBS 339.88]
MNIQNRLPATFRSLYRLFLRTSSAAVLHQRQARKNLRERWRPIFDVGAKVTQELQHKPADATHSWIRGREEWLRTWNIRVDHTLELLYASSQARGLPHRLTRNLGFMVANEKQRLIAKVTRSTKWDPLNPRTVLKAKEFKQIENRTKDEQFHENANGALDEVIRMAEATGTLTLGRNNVPVRRWPRSRK